MASPYNGHISVFPSTETRQQADSVPASVEQRGSCTEPSTLPMPETITKSSPPYRIRTSSRIHRKQTTFSISSSSYLTVSSRSHRRILTDGFESQERAWVYIYICMGMGLRAGIRHQLPPSSAGASFYSLPKIPTVSAADPAQHRQRGKLCQIWLVRMPRRRNATIFIACNRCLFRCAKLTFLPKFRLFSILDPMGPQPSTTTHIHLILIPIVAHYGPSEPPRALFTSGFLHRCRPIAVAQFWTYGEKKLGKAWHLRHLRWSFQTPLRAQHAMEWAC